MKKLSAIIALTFLATTAHADTFNIKSYCREVADAVGGSYQIEESCRKIEKESKNKLSRRKVPARIRSYCYEVAKAVGGSYQILESCIDMELEAKGRL